MSPRARYLIDRLALVPHPEGGLYRRVFASAAQDAAGRACVSSIFFLLLKGQVSRWHCLDADEIWHYHEGDPLELLLAESPERLRRETLGPIASVEATAQKEALPQRAVPAQVWQAARCLGDYTLVSCTVAPAFRFDHFRLFAHDPAAQTRFSALLRQFPEFC
ncbi:MAG: cupin domain-containing protein [Zoogloeaceae bacterium]|jgi:predicted cupin superfamily sugar epimerase|nr:cupin domain-containing protein [Zoogloeaceae bacterium]